VIPNFEWDAVKAVENRIKHGVSFEEAATVFGDDDALIEDDVEHSEGEDRSIITGTSARENVLLTVYTIRSEDIVRIISSRRALPHERRTYEEKSKRR
jgi:uncharacterized DUF497 family protein